VVVGDPAIADVSVESPRRVIVFGKSAGSTTLLVLDGGHRTVLEAQVLVVPGGPGAVTVTYGAGKDIKQLGGVSAVFACAASCTRATDRKPAEDKPAGK
jgi:Flp pilus assembly secretin CpaC